MNDLDLLTLLLDNPTLSVLDVGLPAPAVALDDDPADGQADSCSGGDDSGNFPMK